MENKEISISTKEIITRLAKLQADMNYIKEHIEDTELSKEDLEAIEEYSKEKKEGKLVPHNRVKKELNL